MQGSHGEGADGVKGRSMPGIVSMDRNGVQGATMGKMNDRPLAAPAGGPPKVNGDVPLPQLDGSSDMNGKAITNGAASLSHSPAAEAPPELTHFTEFYMPFGKLIGRVAQETNNTLGELLDKMGDLQISSAPAMNGINGHMTNGSTPHSRENEDKKKLMLEWAWGEREKFIKLLVLSKWSRNCDDVSKMIDLNAWLTEQMNHYEEAPKWIGQLKLNMEPAKAPNPDLKTALEVLSTGKAPWMPDVCLLFQTIKLRKLTESAGLRPRGTTDSTANAQDRHQSQCASSNSSQSARGSSAAIERLVHWERPCNLSSSIRIRT